MYESSNKEPPSIIYFILKSKDFVCNSINSEKQIFSCMLLGSIRESVTRLCMDYNISTNLESTSWKFFISQKQPPEVFYKKRCS